MEAGGLDAAAGGGLTPMALVRHHGVLPRLHASAYVAPGAQLVGEVLVGEDSSIWFNAVLRGDINRVVVGDRTNLQDGSVVHVTSALPALIDMLRHEDPVRVTIIQTGESVRVSVGAGFELVGEGED